MSLPTGTRLGAYEILDRVGAGGMGEVYRARDSKLGREVALKILPTSVSADAERRARFEREAQAVAALSHPNVIAVHEFGTHEDQLFVVMELLRGQTLREALVDGPLPARKAIDIATQVARGLASAHQKQLIHRDLKPENIFLLDDGQVKILDFGLARSLAAPTAAAGTAETVAATDPGTVMGTVGYMAPEQVRGGGVDARADLFALGAVLYEMLAGRRAFQRDTAAETMTAVLREDPPEISAARQDLPPALERIVQHALEKNPQERFQSASDVVFALTSLSGTRGAVSGPQPAAREGAPRARGWLPLVAAGLVLAGLGATLAWWLATRQGVDAPRWDRFTQLTDAEGREHAPHISPDGGSFTFVSRSRGTWDVYVQRVGGRNPVLVAGDPVREEAWPRFSPDGRFIAFNEEDADGGIFIVGATGESERRLTDFGGNPAWSPDGSRIAFATESVDVPHDRAGASSLWIVDVAGGAPTRLYEGDAVQPAWSPSGRRIAFWAAVGGQRDLKTVAADGTDLVAVTDDAALDWGPTWSPDGRYLYFASNRGGSMGLWRIPMDEARGQPIGVPESVAGGVETAMEVPSFSSDGRTLLFRAQTESTNPAAIAFDPVAERTGDTRLLTARTGMLLPSSVSPDGEWLALSSFGERQEDLFVMRRDGSGLRRLTDDEPRDRQPRWARDGKSLVFYSNRSGPYRIWSIRPDGSGLTMLLESPGRGLIYGTPSPVDDRLVASPDFVSNTGAVMARPPFPASGQQLQALEGTASEASTAPSAWSPDGRWLSGNWVSKAGLIAGVGVLELASGRASRVSEDLNIGTAPFLPDSRRLVYFTSEGQLVVVDVPDGQQRVIPVTLPFPPAPESIAVAPDGRTLYYGAQKIESNVWKVEQARREPTAR